MQLGVPFTEMADISSNNLEDFQATQRNRQNKAGEAQDRNGLKEYFDDIAEDYDKFKELSNWTLGKTICVSALHTLTPDPSIRILDCGTGTGQMAEELIKRGYKNIDGLDMSMKMLDVAKAKGLLQNIICDSVDGEHQTNIPDDTYDAVIMGGTFSPGQMDQAAFPELTRITKTGGFLVFNVSLMYLKEWKLFKEGKLDEAIRRNIDAGIWKGATNEVVPYWKDELCMLYTISI